MRQFPCSFFLLGIAAALNTPAGAQEPPPNRPVVLEVRLENQAISPVTARFLNRAIRQAEELRADCLILVLDTPGGLVDSTRAIVKDILASKVPIVVYVAPPGARAASAGVFITQAGHVAAMAPGTNIGAAHPVQIGGLPSAPPDQPEKDAKNKEAPRSRNPMQDKIVNDTVAWARALAQLRGRNTDWVERAVRESISVPASEAVKEGAVDLLATDMADLLNQIHGRKVTLPGGSVLLRTQDAEVRRIEMWWGERLLAVITNPNVAFLLLMLGFYGILFEFFSPGWGVAGTLGVIFLLLGFFSLSVLPVNYAGLALLGVALALFVAEAFITSYGALTIGGIICLLLGGTMLLDSPIGFPGVSLGVLVPVALATALITMFLMASIVHTHRHRVQTGLEGWAGTRAVALNAFIAQGGQYSGTTRVHGEIWSAISPSPIGAGEPVEILGRDGLTLRVKPTGPVAPA